MRDSECTCSISGRLTRRIAASGATARIPMGRVVTGTGVNLGWSWHIEDRQIAEVRAKEVTGVLDVETSSSSLKTEQYSSRMFIEETGISTQLAGVVAVPLGSVTDGLEADDHDAASWARLATRSWQSAWARSLGPSAWAQRPAVVYILNGSVVMEVEASRHARVWRHVRRVTGGCHLVARNASTSATAKFLVSFVKGKSAALKADTK